MSEGPKPIGPGPFPRAEDYPDGVLPEGRTEDRDLSYPSPSPPAREFIPDDNPSDPGDDEPYWPTTPSAKPYWPKR